MTPKEVYELLSKTVRDADQKLRELECYFEVELDLGNDWSIAWLRGKVEGDRSWRVHLAEGEGEFIPLESRKILERLDALKLIPKLEEAIRAKLVENLEKIQAGVEQFRNTYLEKSDEVQSS